MTIKQRFRVCLTGSINSGLSKVREVNHWVQLICREYLEAVEEVED